MNFKERLTKLKNKIDGKTVVIVGLSMTTVAALAAIYMYERQVRGMKGAMINEIDVHKRLSYIQNLAHQNINMSALTADIIRELIKIQKEGMESQAAVLDALRLFMAVEEPAA